MMNRDGDPALERIDRAFASVEWLQLYPFHHLRSLSSNCSDHSPLLLVLNSNPWAVPRFCFEQFWTCVGGFVDMIQTAWGQPNPNVNACKNLDIKLRGLARFLRSWSRLQGRQCHGSASGSSSTRSMSLKSLGGCLRGSWSSTGSSRRMSLASPL